MNSDMLGTLEPVVLRTVWTDEAREFTPWLSKPENLERLSKALDLELELEGTEILVGPFKADLVANETGTNSKVIIESQLERTNHDHLGKIITYASGLRANTIIWIAKEFTEEHRQAIDFLNEVAGPGLRVYAVEIRLYRIGNSPPAPFFEIISSPNEYAATAKQEEGALTETKALYLDFWTRFREYCESRGSNLNLTKPHAQQWYGLAVGRSKFGLNLTATARLHRIGCEIYIGGIQAKRAFKLLEADKQSIEQELGSLEWMKLRQDARIVTYKHDIDIQDETSQQTAFEWLRQKAESFYRTFSPRIKALPIADEPETEAELDRQAE